MLEWNEKNGLRIRDTRFRPVAPGLNKRQGTVGDFMIQKTKMGAAALPEPG